MCLACGYHHNSVGFVENSSGTQAIKYFSLNSASHLANPENVAKHQPDFSPPTHRRALGIGWITCAKMNSRSEVASKALAFQWIPTRFTHRATMEGDVSPEVSNCDPLVVFFLFYFNSNFANIVSAWDKRATATGDYWTSMGLFQGSL